jgi:hypothetical protein
MKADAKPNHTKGPEGDTGDQAEPLRFATLKDIRYSDAWHEWR